jgi:hypothetical protein
MIICSKQVHVYIHMCSRTKHKIVSTDELINNKNIHVYLFTTYYHIYIHYIYCRSGPRTQQTKTNINYGQLPQYGGLQFYRASIKS